MPILPKMTREQAVEFVRNVEIISHSVTGGGGMDQVGVDDLVLTFRCFSTGELFSLNLEPIVGNIQIIDYVPARVIDHAKFGSANASVDTGCIEVDEHYSSFPINVYDKGSAIRTIDGNFFAYCLISCVSNMFDDEADKHVSFGFINTSTDEIIAVIRVASIA